MRNFDEFNAFIIHYDFVRTACPIKKEKCGYILKQRRDNVILTSERSFDVETTFKRRHVY